MNISVLVALVLVVLALFLNACADDLLPPASLPPTPDYIPLDKTNAVFLAGVNYPWHQYGHDFGKADGNSGGGWAHDGVSKPESYALVDEHFAFLASKGVSFVRCFVFCDGRSSPEFDTEGAVIGFDEKFHPDFSALLEIADRHSIQLVAVLLDYLWLDEPRFDGGVQLGGHSDIITDSRKKSTFFTHCLRPFLERYGTSSAIAAWEIINEPEWFVKDLSGFKKTGVTLREMQDFIRESAALCKEFSTKPITLGSAKSHWLYSWTELGLDFYQVHNYDVRYAPPFLLKNETRLDKPVIIGEFPTAQSTISLSRYMNAAWNNGFAGALAWSFNGNDEYSQFRSAVADEFLTWQKTHQRE